MTIFWKLYAWMLYRYNKRPAYFQAYIEISKSLCTDMRLLHVGCGVRTLEEYISHERANVEVEAVDFHRRLIWARFPKFVNQNSYSKDLDLGFREDRPKRFDIVVLEQAFANIPVPQYQVEDMRKLLKDGGILIAIVASCPAPTVLRILRWLLNIPQVPHFDRDSVRELFETENIMLSSDNCYWFVRTTIHHKGSKQPYPKLCATKAA